MSLISEGLSVPFTNGRTTNRFTDGVFGWYQYVQDFTGRFALDWLDRLAREGDTVWEPFSGSGTTLVASKIMGLDSYGYDISPFMVDVAKTKVDWTIPPAQLDTALQQVLSEAPACTPTSPESTRWADYEVAIANSTAPYPDDPKLRKWISPFILQRFSRLVAIIDRIENRPIRMFLKLAAAGILIPVSNMEFRPNISYQSRPYIDYPVTPLFRKRAMTMIQEYRSVYGMSLDTKTFVALGDARYDGPDNADLIFTSPPYPNDMEYVHQTRLELMLLSYVDKTRDLTTLKKRMIPSSVKLVYRSNEWQKASGLEIASVKAVTSAISETLKGKNWGWNASDMTAQYFGGIRSVLSNWVRRLNPGGCAAVVIGDSAFNGVKVPTDKLFADCAIAEGFHVEDIEPFRSRSNNKHSIKLRESVVLLYKEA